MWLAIPFPRNGPWSPASAACLQSLAVLSWVRREHVSEHKLIGSCPEVVCVTSPCPGLGFKALLLEHIGGVEQELLPRHGSAKNQGCYPDVTSPCTSWGRWAWQHGGGAVSRDCSSKHRLKNTTMFGNPRRHCLKVFWPWFAREGKAAIKNAGSSLCQARQKHAGVTKDTSRILKHFKRCPSGSPDKVMFFSLCFRLRTRAFIASLILLFRT